VEKGGGKAPLRSPPRKGKRGGWILLGPGVEGEKKRRVRDGRGGKTVFLVYVKKEKGGKKGKRRRLHACRAEKGGGGSS